MIRWFRKSYGTFFALQALFLLGLVQKVIHGHIAGPSAVEPTITVTLRIAVITAIVVILGIISGVAAWLIYREKSAVRSWGIAASIVTLLISSPFVYLSFEADLPGFLVYFSAAVMVIGIIGVVLFALRSNPNPPGHSKGNEPIAGDGTNAILNKVVWIIGTVFGLAGVNWWKGWGNAHLLPHQTGWTENLLIVPILAITILVHELGHAVAAVSVGMKISSFTFGPLDWRINNGRWKFSFSISRLRSVGGAVGVASTRADEPTWFRIWIATAGPFANLLLGAASAYLAMNAKGSPYENSWGMLADLATISIGTFILNLIPVRVGGFYSDGAKVLQMLSGGVWADHLKLHYQTDSCRLTALRPRDYDLACIKRLAKNIETPLLELLCRLYALEYHLDRGEILDATDDLEQAVSASTGASASLTVELCTELVFAIVFLRRDVGAAQVWWLRMESLKPTRSSWDYWLAHSALNWIEGNLEVANESWAKGNLLAQQLPKAGAYEFDRHCFGLLRVAIDESTATQSSSRELGALQPV